jgi:hypothetical protein
MRIFRFRERHVRMHPTASSFSQSHQPLVLQPVPLHPVIQPVHYQTIPINPIPQGATVQPVLQQQQMTPLNRYSINYQTASGQQPQQQSVQQTVIGPTATQPVHVQPSFNTVYSQQAPAVHPVHLTANPGYDSVTHTQPHMQSRWTDNSGPNGVSDLINNDAFAQRRHRLYGYDESAANGHSILHSQQVSDDRSRALPRSDTSVPVPAIYCEPTRYGGDSHWTQDGNFSGLGSALMTESRGVQNVPMMNTTGVQYTLDTNGNAWPSPTDGSANPQPLILTGRACPLCGASHYHAHVDTNAPVAASGINGMVQQLHRTSASLPHAGQQVSGVNSMLAVTQQPHYVIGSVPSAEQQVTSVSRIFPPGQQPHNVTGSVPSVEQYIASANGLQAIPQQPHYVVGSLPSAEQHLAGVNGFIQQQPHIITGLAPSAGQHVTRVNSLHVIPQHPNATGSVPTAGQQAAYVVSQYGTG